MIKDSKYLQRVAFGLSLLIPLVYFGFYAFHTSDVPAYDEYRTILYEFGQFFNAEQAQDYFGYFFDDENESIQLVLKVWMVICFYLKGEISFYFTTFLGNLALISIYGLAYLIFKKAKMLNAWQLLPLALLFYSFQYPLVSLRADASFYYFVGYACTLWAIFCLIWGHWKRFVLLFVLAVFSNASSILLIPIALIHLTVKKEWKRLAIMSILSIVILLLFFGNSPAFSGINEGKLSYLLPNILLLFGNFIDVGFISFPVIMGAKVFGCITLSTYAFILFYTFRRYLLQKSNWLDQFALFSIGFTVATLLIIALKRGGMDAENNLYLVHERYKFFSMVPLFLSLLYGSIKLSKYKMAAYFSIVTTLLLGGFYFFTFIHNYERVIGYNKGLLLDAAQIESIGKVVTDEPSEGDLIRYTEIQNRKDFYNFKTTSPFNEIFEMAQKGNPLGKYPWEIKNESYQLEVLPQKPKEDFIVLSTMASDPILSVSDGIYIILRSDDFSIVYPAKNRQNSFKSRIRTTSIQAFEVSTLIFPSVLKKGNYKILVLEVNEGELNLYSTESSIII